MPTNASGTRSFDDFLARALQNPDTRASYEDSQTRHRAIDALVRLRNRLDLTQTDVAKHMGVKQPTVSGFETEGSDPRLSTLQRYARAVNASVWVHVVPNTLAGKRMDFYVSQCDLPDHASEADVTDRAAIFAASRRRYRHLAAVPNERVPA